MDEVNNDDLFKIVLTKVIEGEGSPYKQLLKWVNDIDVKYFEKINRNGNVIDEKLNLNLKEAVLQELQEVCDGLLDSDLMQGLLSEANLQFDVKDEKVLQRKKAFAKRLKSFTSGDLALIPSPPCTEEELEDKWKKAKTVTIVENVFGSNSSDIVDFYHALLGYTVWECNALIEKNTMRFLDRLAENLDT